MQCNFYINFTLKNPSSSLMEAFESINNIHIKETLGGHINRKAGNLKRLKLTIPSLKKTISFTISDEDITKIGEQIQLYNLACSLQTCSIVHFLNKNGILEISVLTDMEDAEFISFYYKMLKSKE